MKTLMTVCTAAMLLVPHAKGETIAWYRFNEGTIGRRVGSSVIIENAAKPGHLVGKCQQVDTNGAFSDSEVGFVPFSTNAFPNGVGVSVASAKYANEQAFFFHNANYDANHASTTVNYSAASAVTVAHDAVLELSSFTVELFFKSSVGNNQSNGDQALVVMPNEKWLAWAIMLTKEGAVSGQFFNTGSYTLAHNAGANDGKWHHVAMTYDGSTTTATLYFDYAQVATRTITGGLVYDTEKPLSIGCMPSRGDRKYVGFIDEVRISDSVLTTTGFLHKAAYVPAVDTADTACYVPFDYVSLSDLSGFAAESGLTDVNASGYGVTAKFTWSTSAGKAPTVDASALPCAILYGATFAESSWSYMSVTNTASLYLTPGSTAGYSASLLVDDIVNNEHTVFNGSFTIEFFAKVPSAPSGNKFLMNLGRTLASGSLLYAWKKSGSDSLDFMILRKGSSAAEMIGSYPGFCDNQWHHIAVSYDRSALTAKAYVDHKVVGTLANIDFDYALTVSDTPAALQVNSAYGWRNNGFDGSWIDEFRLSRRALSCKELLDSTLNKRNGLIITIK